MAAMVAAGAQGERPAAIADSKRLGKMKAAAKGQSQQISLPLLAFVLAAIGIYGVISYDVAQRTNEIGVRMALGARSGDVLRMILRQGLVLTVCGLGAGLAGAIGLTRFLSGLLFEVKPTDFRMAALPLLVLFGAAMLAALPPALRAVRIDPARTLRGD